VIAKESRPALACVVGRRQAPEVPPDRAFRDVEAKLEELTVDSRSAPCGISFAIYRMRARTSASIFGLPRLLWHDRRRKNNPKPAQCQATMVSGLKMTRICSMQAKAGETESKISDPGFAAEDEDVFF
jgi:hypothetical protein